MIVTLSQLDYPWGGRGSARACLLCAYLLVFSSGLGTIAHSANPPYLPSPVIERVEWAPASEIVRMAKGGDNWPATWADDGNLYTAYGDGNGFKPNVEKKLSLGFARVEGNPPDLRGVNLRTDSGEQIGDGAKGKKASGLLAVNGVLYMWTRNAGNSQLAYSEDRGKTWTWLDWKFSESFGCPTFLNFGQDYEGARDGYVYSVSADRDGAYEAADRTVMVRVSKKRMLERDAYEFFQRRDASGEPHWSKDIAQRGAVFSHPHRCYRSGMTYNPALKRYFWCQILPGEAPRFEGGFGIYDAPEPWGPWTTVFFTEKWDVGPGETSSIPTKWISKDGLTAHLLFSGDDCFSVRKLTFVPKQSKPTSTIFPGREWETASPESQGVDSEKLDAAVAYLKAHCGRDGVRELVVVRNGRMIWAGDSIDKVHGVWSLTKSFTSTVLGLLIDEGKTTLDSLAVDYLPSLAKTYPALSLRHFATMTSGYRAAGDEPRGTYLHGPSLTPFDSNPVPLFAPPGSKYAYWDSAMNQFANVLTRIAGEPLYDYFKRKIAGPIGMNAGEWNWGDFGEIDGAVVNGGSGNNNKHIFICARELARFGLLFLNRGEWDGERLISSEWVDRVHQAWVLSDLPLGHPESGIDGRGVYGLNWWVNGIKADGTRKWPDAPPRTYAASGYNNNDLFVIPEWNTVVVRLGLDQNDVRVSDAVHSSFLHMIGQAVID